MPGRPPSPTHLKLVAGNPVKRPLNDREPAPKVRLPACPNHLPDEARAEWRRMGRKLVRLGVMTEVDAAAFAAYCTAWARWVEAEEALARHGTIVRAPKTGVPMADRNF